MSFYVYLISSLPMLYSGAKPPFSYEKFLELCEPLIPQEDLAILKTIPSAEIYLYEGQQPTLLKWRAFDTLLRNELVKIRASRKHIDAAKYLRPDGYSDPYMTHLALTAHRNPSILEAELMLDEVRWNLLDELAVGHYFDLDFLIVYAIKLFMLERWEEIRSVDKEKILQEIVPS